MATKIEEAMFAEIRRGDKPITWEEYVTLLIENDPFYIDTLVLETREVINATIALVDRANDKQVFRVHPDGQPSQYLFAVWDNAMGINEWRADYEETEEAMVRSDGSVSPDDRIVY